ncbi:uncharacterized protein N7458_002470 [Penicillium daleae]|uniref:Uncharacterized protein n=1 Tax=Penicillium daleae TaxID=63821 RepID=A0AAD6CD58_9EURO|nr:uncharacterized protein N7458_002470 [Penicillium daleae]KAJ5460918.1 hypothetical protein N7458_002470 [Penicillium daleae]
MSQTADIARVYAMREKIKREKTIPEEYLVILIERLPLSFGQYPHQDAPKSGRRSAAYQLRWRLKKAGIVYRRVRRTDPHIFLPFLLSITPRGCESFDDERFEQNHQDRYNLHLSNDCLTLLQAQGRNLKIEDNRDFQDFIKHLFELGLETPYTSPPLTDAEKEDHCTYHLAHVQSIRNVFGDYIQRAVASSLVSFNEDLSCQAVERRDSFWMKFPSQTMQDAIFSLDIGSTKELAAILFPHINPKIASFLWPQTCDVISTQTLDYNGVSHYDVRPDQSRQDREYHPIPSEMYH